MYSQDENTLQSFIAQYQQKIFALVLYLVGQDQDKAYEICALSFTEAIREAPQTEQEDAFVVRLIGIAVEKCRTIKTIPSFDVLDLFKMSGVEKEQLLIVLKALQRLSFEQKLSLLLRYQCNVSYGDIAAVMLLSESDARIKTIQARVCLEKEIGRIVSDA